MPTPVVFIHGLWLHATSWQAWEEKFRAEGFDPIAPEWPGGAPTVAEARATPEAVAGFGVAEIADHYASIIAGLDQKPVVIGHSFGGLLVQNLVGRGITAAGVAIDPAPVKGALPLPFSALRVASVALRDPRNRSRAVSLNLEQFRYGFGNTLSVEESAELFEKWTIPSPGRPLFQAAVANFSTISATKVATDNATRGPLLLTSGDHDHTAPPAIVKASLKQYAGSSAVTELKTFANRGHSLTIDHGWEEIAQASLDFLKQHNIT